MKNFILSFKKKINLLTLILGATVLQIGPLTNKAYSCTAFCLNGNSKVVVGKSYDWFFFHGHGAVYTNLRGIERSGLKLMKSLLILIKLE